MIKNHVPIDNNITLSIHIYLHLYNSNKVI